MITVETNLTYLHLKQNHDNVCICAVLSTATLFRIRNMTVIIFD